MTVDAEKSLERFRKLKKRKKRKRKIRVSSKATTKELYRYPRHTDIEVVVDTNNPRRLILVPFPPGEELAVKISDWLMSKFGGLPIDKELLIDMTTEARKKFCEIRGIRATFAQHECEEDSEEEALTESMDDLEFYLSG